MNKNDFLKVVLNTAKKSNSAKDQIFGKIEVNSISGKFASANVIGLSKDVSDDNISVLAFRGDDDCYYSEIEYTSNTVIAKADISSGAISISASRVSKVNGSQSAIALTNQQNGDSVKAVVLLIALMTYEKLMQLPNREEVKEHFTNAFLLGEKVLKEKINSLASDFDLSNLQTSLEFVSESVKDFIRDNEFDMNVIAEGTKEFTELDASSFSYDNFNVIDIENGKNNAMSLITKNSEKSIFMKPIKKGKKKINSTEMLKDMKLLAINKNPLTEGQLVAYKTLENQMKNISIPDSLERTMKMVSTEISGRKNVRNMIMQGLPGAGKSFMTKILAYCNNMLHTQELGSGEKIYPTDFFATLIPNTEKFEGLIDENGGLDVNRLIEQNNTIPSLTDALFMPEMAYKVLTNNDWVGSNPPTLEDLAPLIDEHRQEIYEQTINELLLTKNNTDSGNSDFVMVYTELGKALIEGNYVVDVQEIDTIKNPDSLSFLYEVLEEGWVSLPNGKKVQRHPNTIVCFTVNGATGGDITKPLPPAFRDRCQVELKFGEMTVEEMADRIYASYNGKVKKNILMDMARFIKVIEDFIQDENLEGFVGFRSLSNWVDATVRTGDSYQSCIDTVINKTTDDPEEIENMIVNILDNSKFKIEESTKVSREILKA